MIVSQFLIFLLMFIALSAAIKARKTSDLAKEATREKRETIESRKLSIPEKVSVRVIAASHNAGFTVRAYMVITAAAFLTGTGLGFILFSGMELALATGVAFLPLPYIYMLMRGQAAVRRELESLENTMSVITNAYMGGNDIVDAFYIYVMEKNRYRDPSKIEPTPFDEFVTEVLLINPDVERGLYLLESKIRNYHFSEWVKMLQMCHQKKGLKFALLPIVKAMGDAKAMQIESDTQMSKVWKDYIMTVALMFGIIPILRFANADWYSILTTTSIGKLLIALMLVMALISAFIVTRITRPIGTSLGRSS